jgi:shikimate dehydrogenase
MDAQIRGDSRVVCLLGYPVAHSLSPQIHNHAFRSLGLPYVYIPMGIPLHALHSAVYTLRASPFAGANVTIPYKGMVINYCDSISELSRCTGTVNTLYFNDGKLCGTTTDPEGFKRALASAGFKINGSHVVILGNGGTARTLSIALGLDKNVSSLTIVGRNRFKIDSLADEIVNGTGFPVQGCSFDDVTLDTIMMQCTLLVNCTSVGMYPATNKSPLPSKYFHKNMMVFDAIYNPVKTRLLQDAEVAGCIVQNGLKMLLYQGLASFKYWTGIDAPEELFDINELERMVHR